MADEGTQSKMVPNITICIIVAASAGVMLTIYHCLTANNILDMLNLGRTGNANNHHQRPTLSQDHQATPRFIEASVGQLIPSYKYQKGGDHNNDHKGVAEKDDGMCPVCLSDFEDGEEVRSLPGCLHSFHAPCIDMWLYSHQNCPVCRAIATPSPRMLSHLISSNSESPVAADMLMHYTSPTDRLV